MQLLYTTSVILTVSGIGATTVGTGGDWLVLQLLGLSFQKARNFTASSHQNAGFSICVFTNVPGVIPCTLTAGRSDPLPHPTCGTQTLVPLNFSAVVAPLVSGMQQSAHGQ